MVILIDIILFFCSIYFYIKYIYKVNAICKKILILDVEGCGIFSGFKYTNYFFVLSDPVFTHKILFGNFVGVNDEGLFALLKKARGYYFRSIFLFLAFGLGVIYEVHFN